MSSNARYKVNIFSGQKFSGLTEFYFDASCEKTELFKVRTDFHDIEFTFIPRNVNSIQQTKKENYLVDFCREYLKEDEQN